MTRLSEFIDQHEMTQRELARAARIDESTISNICRGLIPKRRLMRRITAALERKTGQKIKIENLWPIGPLQAAAAPDPQPEKV